MEREPAPRVVVDSGHRCPYCHEPVLADQEKEACRACMAWHHQGCWAEHGARCAACGRPPGAASGPPRADPRPRLTGALFLGVVLFGGVVGVAVGAAAGDEAVAGTLIGAALGTALAMVLAPKLARAGTSFPAGDCGARIRPDPNQGKGAGEP